MAISKLILDGQVQMDVTQDTVTANALLSGYTATRADGEKIEGLIGTKSASDATISGANINVPAGYYPDGIRTSVQTGSEGTPVATKSTVSNNSVTITPSVTNTEGYISGSTKTGSAVSVTASDLVSGSQTITTNQTVDVTNLAEVVVNVPPNNQNKTVNPSLSQQIVTADSGYTGLGNVVVTAMPVGTEGTPVAIKGDVINNSITVTPAVENIEGYISGGTITGRSVGVTASELVSGSRTITTNQTVDVTNLAEVVVAVSDEDMINNQDKTVTPSTSVQNVEADAGYTGLGTVTVNAMPEGEEGTPVAETSTDSSNNIVITPKVTNSAGYISGGLRVGAPVTINPGVTSFNGETGDITYEAPVTSVNGETGDVEISVPTKVSDLENDLDYISDAGVVSFNGEVGDIMYTPPVLSVNGQTGAVSLTIPATPNDYVVEQGTKNGWRYRKWHSKVYECWRSIPVATRNFTAWGTVYASSSTDSIAYPVTFSSVPWEYASPAGGTSSVWLDRSGANTTTKSATYEGIRPVSGQANFGIIIYVVGTVS